MASAPRLGAHGNNRRPVRFTVVGVDGSQANNGDKFYTTLAALQGAIYPPGFANSLLIRTTSKSHGFIDTLAIRLEKPLPRTTHLRPGDAMRYN